MPNIMKDYRSLSLRDFPGGSNPNSWNRKDQCLLTNLLHSTWNKSPRTSHFMQRLPRPASVSPLHCWQPSIFGCWSSGVEVTATGGYTTLLYWLHCLAA